MAGYQPFHDRKNKPLFSQIKEADFDFPDDPWKNISAEGLVLIPTTLCNIVITYLYVIAKDLICQLLVVDPSKRWTAAQSLQHPWILGTKLPQPVNGSNGAQAEENAGDTDDEVDDEESDEQPTRTRPKRAASTASRKRKASSSRLATENATKKRKTQETGRTRRSK